MGTVASVRTLLRSAARSLSTMSSPYSVRQIGAANTLEFRAFLEKDGKVVSPFHDVPLFANEDKTVLNPILQDTKKGKLRFVRNCFPHKGYIWNYGAFPRTWEAPSARARSARPSATSARLSR